VLNQLTNWTTQKTHDQTNGLHKENYGKQNWKQARSTTNNTKQKQTTLVETKTPMRLKPFGLTGQRHPVFKQCHRRDPYPWLTRKAITGGLELTLELDPTHEQALNFADMSSACAKRHCYWLLPPHYHPKRDELWTPKGSRFSTWSIGEDRRRSTMAPSRRGRCMPMSVTTFVQDNARPAPQQGTPPPDPSASGVFLAKCLLKCRTLSPIRNVFDLSKFECI
jgi:hypothetical protein